METFEVNCLAPLTVVQALVAEGLLGGKELSLIVNVSSRKGSIGTAQRGDCAYRVSKAALNMLTKLIAIELSPGVIAVMMHPGRVRTEMTGFRAPLSVEESVQGMLRQVEQDPQRLQGAFISYDGTRIPY